MNITELEQEHNTLQTKLELVQQQCARNRAAKIPFWKFMLVVACIFHFGLGIIGSTLSVIYMFSTHDYLIGGISLIFSLVVGLIVGCFHCSYWSIKINPYYP
jgi:uncharacterized membrane protein YcjF (UPF0283 family)